MSERSKLLLDPEKWALTLASHARKGAALGVDCGKMCGDCAFKSDQPHTPEYLEAVDNAAMTLLFHEGAFHCHTSDSSGNNIASGKACAGFLYTLEYLKTIDD